MILGIVLIITFAVSVGAIIQKNHITIGLVILNYNLLLDAIGIVVAGTFIWFFTLQERDNFHVRWLDASRETRILLQDQVRSSHSRFLVNLTKCPPSSNAVVISTELTKSKLVVSFVKARKLLVGWPPT